MSTLFALQTEPEGDAVEGLSRASSRALHPSNVTLDPGVLSAIASGLAAVTLPWELRHRRRAARTALRTVVEHSGLRGVGDLLAGRHGP